MIEKIKEILARYAEVGIDKINDESRLVGDLGLDSMDLVDLVIDLEDEFGVEINDRDLWNIQTFSDIKTYLSERTQKD
ncbi:phosphopantetheine-binding protein [Ruminiclostridium papyrosolvens DSM 2782]|uniref:Acyl carrier protein n=1 Tax=Ruminiclostridium papyrosolvens DSM 2782 TaxID=588581 RepID=F1TF88_9FIRM|nr:acyl carrier protein [Ruminiclostridium papyrosolvens]EGD47026.1 phosphopantetheine-binding protein [Ruminiclostridium papyrosolvens DSM 2782]WES33724.1 acyl carrier protein [Ruminiclostridium papyrosolvens DSM 2782]